MSNFCSLTGYCSKLEEDFDSDQLLLCANVSKIADALTNNKHSYLVLSDGINCEHIKVQIENGKIIAIERGVGWTSPIDWPKGTTVSYQWTDQAMADAIDCILTEDEDEDGENCDIKINDRVYKYTGTDDNGVKCYEPEGEDLVICDGKNKYTIKNVDFDTEALSGDQILTDGVYTNATVTVKDCKIVNVSSGTKVTIGGCSPGCTCSQCTDNEPAQV